MQSTQYIALLRGINVGGNNLIKMADLKTCLQANGLPDATTYIQSGNILFSSDKTPDWLSKHIQALIADNFGCEVVVVVQSLAEMKHIITHAPKGFGSEPATYKYDVIFLRNGVPASDAKPYLSEREGVDSAALGEGVLYFRRLIAQLTKTHLNKIIGTPIYKDITIRNWNTSSKLLALMEEREASRQDAESHGKVGE